MQALIKFHGAAVGKLELGESISLRTADARLRRLGSWLKDEGVPVRDGGTREDGSSWDRDVLLPASEATAGEVERFLEASGYELEWMAQQSDQQTILTWGWDAERPGHA